MELECFIDQIAGNGVNSSVAKEEGGSEYSKSVQCQIAKVAFGLVRRKSCPLAQFLGLISVCRA